MRNLILTLICALVSACTTQNAPLAPARSEPVPTVTDSKPETVSFRGRIVRIRDEVQFRPITWVVTFRRMSDGKEFECIGTHALLENLGFNSKQSPLTPQKNLAELPMVDVTLQIQPKWWNQLTSWDIVKKETEPNTASHGTALPHRP
ncbi:MAG: hypothetical protein WCN95_07810 [bacterium]